MFATIFGLIFAIVWNLSSIIAKGGGSWLLIVLLSKYSLLGAVITALLPSFYVCWFKPAFIFSVRVVSCLMIFHYHENIQRL